LAEKWSKVRSIRKKVTEAIELKRQEKEIGSSLEAAPTVWLGNEAHLWDSDDEATQDLQSVDFAEIFITSAASVNLGLPPSWTAEDGLAGLWVSVDKAEGEKCARCWKILPDVGTHAAPGVCGRCDRAVA
ncbi:MAG: zinc finger domain-containing protein, partial [Pseudomonadota bacterium]